MTVRTFLHGLGRPPQRPACAAARPTHRSAAHATSCSVVGRTLMATLAVAALGGALGGCAPLIVGGAMVGGSLMYADRRTSGAQVEDQAIELKAGKRISDQLGDRVHINVTSYNRLLLMTGEAATEADRAAAEQIAQRVENVRSVVNEVGVMEPSSLRVRSGDSIVSGKVKASLLDAKDLTASAFKVVTERGTVFLMGRVSEREAARAAEITRTIGGVQRVVRVFEVVSESEIAYPTSKTSQ